MIVLRWIFRLVVALVVLVALTVFGARFHDGPLGPLPGGPLVSGSFVAEPVADWSFATWHISALKDGRATLSIAGKRYAVTLQKVDDPGVLSGVRDVATRKYPSRPGGELWLFQDVAE